MTQKGLAVIDHSKAVGFKTWLILYWNLKQYLLGSNGPIGLF